MNSKLRGILLRFATSELNEMGVQEGAISENKQLFTLEQAEKAIRQAVGEEMLVLKPGVALAEPLASDKEWAEYEGYNKALDDWEQKIKQWQGGEA